jgi:hypothetical protein
VLTSDIPPNGNLAHSFPDYISISGTSILLFIAGNSVLSTRHAPYPGINECISLQHSIASLLLAIRKLQIA